MLMPYLSLLNGKKIILASQSIARKEILEKQGIKFSMLASSFEDNINKEELKKLH